MTLEVVDNAFNGKKADILLEVLRTKSMVGFTFRNYAQPLDYNDNEYDNFSGNVKGFKDLPFPTSFQWEDTVIWPFFIHIISSKKSRFSSGYWADLLLWRLSPELMFIFLLLFDNFNCYLYLNGSRQRRRTHSQVFHQSSSWTWHLAPPRVIIPLTSTFFGRSRNHGYHGIHHHSGAGTGGISLGMNHYIDTLAANPIPANLNNGCYSFSGNVMSCLTNL